MDLRVLKSLAVLARTSNITHAAAQLHLTPSAVHRHLQLLSEDLGLTLYEKQGRTLRLTSAAESLLPIIDELFLNVDALQAAADDWKRLRRGAVRVGAGPTFSSYVLPPFLEAFHRTHPGVDVLLETGHSAQLLSMLSDGHLDVLFLVPSPSAQREFLVELSWEFRVPFVTGPQSGPARLTTLSKLEQYPFLLYKRGSFFEDQIEHYFHRHHFAPRVAMHLDNAEPIKALVRLGFGISLLPEWAVRRELESGDLRLIRIRQQIMTSRIGIIRRRSRHVSAPALALINMAKTWDWNAPTNSGGPSTPAAPRPGA